MMLQRGERIRQFALPGRGIVHAIGREQRQVQSFRDLDRNPVSIFFIAMKMPLQFDVNIRLAKYFRQSLHCFESRLRSIFRERRGQRSFISTSQANQTIGVLNKIRTRRAGSFFAPNPQFHFRNQAAEILISGARGNQQRKTNHQGDTHLV